MNDTHNWLKPNAAALCNPDDWLPAIANNPTLTLSAKASCYLIAHYLDDDGNCHLTHQAIARGITSGDYGAHKVLTWLTVAGWLKPTGPTSYAPSLPASHA